MHDLLRPCPWDTRAFGLEAYELVSASPEALAKARQTPGHHTVKVDPLSSKALLHESGFYYCDTLLETYATPGSFKDHSHPQAFISKTLDLDQALSTAGEAFCYGRFNRDFNLPPEFPARRYQGWVRFLHERGLVYALMYESRQVGFIACEGHHLVLHAIDREYRGRGLSKFLWSAMCRELFSQSHGELTSSVSAANVPVLNLYASLGFRFRSPVDVYHLLVR